MSGVDWLNEASVENYMRLQRKSRKDQYSEYVLDSFGYIVKVDAADKDRGRPTYQGQTSQQRYIGGGPGSPLKPEEATVQEAVDYWAGGILISTTNPLYAWPMPEHSCEHEWKSYVGLVESYSFCVKCDEKSKNGNS